MSIALDNLGFSAAKASIQYILNPTTAITSLPTPDNLHSVGTLSPPNRRQCQVVGCVHFIASRNRCIGGSTVQNEALSKWSQTPWTVLESW
ncbi:hypothetical protein H257_13818 [Aphanomyces astaci]|uniref:Uncharacterized protein n=1 Tax=Aphanomyces astaci TaxID=112090 RepID=W4FTD4_APHAT|nr:hypothetical protein H257_13818 [Aphanomyces astaci]ETV70722.1 hypothetical protein H257_13818 [Aphanomyces astaci]|eukprot:XP_009839786.1 hypothetical protein H257_13818 [Aphanomyces astaci]